MNKEAFEAGLSAALLKAADDQPYARNWFSDAVEGASKKVMAPIDALNPPKNPVWAGITNDKDVGSIWKWLPWNKAEATKYEIGKGIRSYGLPLAAAGTALIAGGVWAGNALSGNTGSSEQAPQAKPQAAQPAPKSSYALAGVGGTPDRPALTG